MTSQADTHTVSFHLSTAKLLFPLARDIGISYSTSRFKTTVSYQKLQTLQHVNGKKRLQSSDYRALPILLHHRAISIPILLQQMQEAEGRNVRSATSSTSQN